MSTDDRDILYPGTADPPQARPESHGGEPRRRFRPSDAGELTGLHPSDLLLRAHRAGRRRHTKPEELLTAAHTTSYVDPLASTVIPAGPAVTTPIWAGASAPCATPSREFHGDNPSFLGARQLWWPTRTAFEDGVAADQEAFTELAGRGGHSLTVLVQSERVVR